MSPFYMAAPISDKGPDPFNLGRFVLAQRDIYLRALSEIVRGRKSTHWMWFIFPQVRGLGRSYESQYYGIASLDEARAYLLHAVLGDRLKQCVTALLNIEESSALAIFGPIDEMKLRSSLTLFRAASNEPVFAEAIKKFFNGVPDTKTLDILGLTK